MTLLPSSFDPLLVTCSVVVAWLASYATLTLVSQVHTHKTRTPLWIALGAVLLGFGIWSMHFIGMLAFRLPETVTYDVPGMILSWLAAVLASGYALFIASRPQPTRFTFGQGALIMGGAINGMHFLGMHAMHVNASVQYNPALVALSILIAVSASWGALQLALHKVITGGDDARPGCLPARRRDCRDALRRHACRDVPRSQ
ncbi:MHYT domain-containing protein [Deinococcus peraridilitoris]|uniref:Bacterial signaling protein N terminal repeat protein n=1 Tax=Deinococcus peraridilitoris (strain DSM 19664 / LMG 22246 / CIP 109416 / KR-200) TaxID=937777 RepID=L0A1A0_DEIPD|nr:MHYT domain-containing protein [Deinococcus peraridilitoris]AFZ67229.1 Bacterial signaling protein N terminal repeat protein [Deinococcus peraridilitoris DSM 19664]